MCDNDRFFRASAEDFKKIPGAPLAYWAGENLFNDFSLFKQIGDFFEVRNGITTSDNDLFLRYWFEIGFGKFIVKWFPCNKGGAFRKWYGNRDYLVDWENDGDRLKNYTDENGKLRPTLRGIDMNFRMGITMSRVTSGTPSFRLMIYDSISESATNAIYPMDDGLDSTYHALALLNSPVGGHVLKIENPTINVVPEDVRNFPYEEISRSTIVISVANLVSLSRADWDSYETSWDFKANPLVALAREPDPAGAGQCGLPLASLYARLRSRWAADCEEMRRLETENNRIFIEAYGLQEELSPEVPWNEITLTCNPWYRYGADAPDGGDRFPVDRALEARLQSDTARELVSYAVGCMMGRYSLESPGLILADQGAGVAEYNALVPNAVFKPDEDGIIPVLDGDWFADDIVTRFKEFVRAAFGEAHFFENIAWIEDSLGKSVRDYFTRDFYKDHLQRYQNRPIYWLFQSPKGAFRALVYMHRYRPDTVGGVLGYLRSLQTKVDNQLDVAIAATEDQSLSNSARLGAAKDATKYAKAKKELDDYERNVLYPLSTERVAIDLDDGVKVNYAKFGGALARVKALEAKGE